VLTGKGGGDAFVFAKLPWNAGHVTDFAVGTDRLDLSAIFQASGYAGSDPVADGRMTLQSDGAGGTKVYFDHDATNGGDWPFLITTLDQVSPTGLTWAQLSADTGGTSGPPPGGGSGEVINSPGPGSTLTGGAGDDTLNASQGQDQLTGAGGADHFVWRNLPWNAGHVTDFVSGQDKLDLRPLFQASSYSGSDPIADRWLEFRPDGAGNTQVYVDHDGPDTGDWPFLITTLDGVAPAQIAASDWIFR
jgi:Ca2+-binding RTX toxin-like protein